jgi:ubiquitin carboxyl-terminal hydrolase 9/13
MQQDAHEFFIYLLNEIHEALQKSASPADGAAPKSKKEAETFVHSIFGGVLTNEMKCLCCENVSTFCSSYFLFPNSSFIGSYWRASSFPN